MTFLTKRKKNLPKKSTDCVSGPLFRQALVFLKTKEITSVLKNGMRGIPMGHGSEASGIGNLISL